MQAAGSLVQTVSMKRVVSSRSQQCDDTLAVEEPLAIRLRYWFKDTCVNESLAVTMRTPGHDRELAVGFLYSEGLIQSQSDIADIRPLGTEQEPANELLVELTKDADVEIWRTRRASFVNSSCGICGKRSIDAVIEFSRIRQGTGFSIEPSSIHRLPAMLREKQEGFAQTGGLHAASLISAQGEVQVEQIFEDIGRHNALDKLIGSLVLQDRVPIEERILFLSSRSSFELVQKAAAAGVPVLATVGSPSSLAVESARRCGLTLIGFVRNERFNVYSGEWRINSE
jgi:FdhD protein